MCSYKLGEGERQTLQAELPEGGARTMQEDILRMQNLILVLSQRVLSLEGRFNAEFGSQEAEIPTTTPSTEGNFWVVFFVF